LSALTQAGLDERSPHVRTYWVLGWTGLCVIGWLVSAVAFALSWSCRNGDFICFSGSDLWLIAAVAASFLTAGVWAVGVFVLAFIAALGHLRRRLKGRYSSSSQHVRR
jgi:hypothetical protein